MPGNTPDRGIFRRRVGKNDFFSKKAGKTLIVFKKDLNIKSGKITHMQHLLWTTWIIKERSEQVAMVKGGVKRKEADSQKM